MSNILNGRMSACSITFGGVNIGHTSGGVTFHYEPKTDPITFDQYGDSPADIVLHGENVQVVANLAEPVVAVLNSVMPAGANVNGAGGIERLGFGTDAGYGLRQDAQVLVLHPLDRAASDLSEDVTIYLAVVADTVELNYEADKQRVFEVTWTALVSETYGSGRRLGHIGVTNVS